MSSCDFDYVKCGDVVTGNTKDLEDKSGAKWKEKNYIFFTFAPVRVTATTCGGTIDGVTNGGTSLISADVSVYDECPAYPRANRLAQSDPLFFCAMTKVRSY